MVISHYLGMFSLDDNNRSYTKQRKTVISHYLGMFSLDSGSSEQRARELCYFPLSWDVLIRYCPPEPLFLAGSKGDLRGKPLQGIFSRFYFSKNARKRLFYAVRGKLKNHLSELYFITLQTSSTNSLSRAAIFTTSHLRLSFSIDSTPFLFFTILRSL